MKKSEVTREKILKQGMAYASTFGLLNITIGEIAKASEMSRTGVISHFKNKEAMQTAILKYTEEIFVEDVLKKSYSQDPLENLNNLKTIWLNWITTLELSQKGSCPFIKAAVEYKDREHCSIRAYMKNQQQRLLSYLAELSDRCKNHDLFTENTNSNQFSYEFYSIYLGHNIQKLLLPTP